MPMLWIWPSVSVCFRWFPSLRNLCLDISQVPRTGSASLPQGVFFLSVNSLFQWFEGRASLPTLRPWGIWMCPTSVSYPVGLLEWDVGDASWALQFACQAMMLPSQDLEWIPRISSSSNSRRMLNLKGLFWVRDVLVLFLQNCFLFILSAEPDCFCFLFPFNLWSVISFDLY